MVSNITLHKINFSYYAPNCQEYQLKSHDKRNLIKQYPRSTLEEPSWQKIMAALKGVGARLGVVK